MHLVGFIICPRTSDLFLSLSLSLFLSLRVGTGCRVQPVSYSMSTTGFFPGIKRQGLDDDGLAPYSAEVEIVRNYTSNSSCLHGVNWGI